MMNRAGKAGSPVQTFGISLAEGQEELDRWMQRQETRA